MLYYLMYVYLIFGNFICELMIEKRKDLAPSLWWSEVKQR